MASVEAMTLDDIQREIHALFQNGIDVPAEGEEDYTLRTTFINNAIGEWEHTPGVKWRELYAYEDLQTVADGRTEYDVSPALKEMGGPVKLVLSPTNSLEIDMYDISELGEADLGETYGYLAGRPGNYVLNLIGIPSEWIGAQVTYRYYRYATKLEAAADVPDMDNPQYIIFSVTARLHKLGHSNSDYTVNFEDAQAALKAMVTKNNNIPNYNRVRPLGHRIQSIGTMGL